MSYSSILTLFCFFISVRAGVINPCLGIDDHKELMICEYENGLSEEIEGIIKEEFKKEPSLGFRFFGSEEYDLPTIDSIWDHEFVPHRRSMDDLKFDFLSFDDVLKDIKKQQEEDMKTFRKRRSPDNEQFQLAFPTMPDLPIFDFIRPKTTPAPTTTTVAPVSSSDTTGAEPGATGVTRAPGVSEVPAAITEAVPLTTLGGRRRRQALPLPAATDVIPSSSGSPAASVPTAVSSLVSSIASSVAPPVVPSVAPSVAPSVLPSVAPSVGLLSSVAPPVVPSVAPSVLPSVGLLSSVAPPVVPSVAPSVGLLPSVLPSAAPTVTPSAPVTQK